MNGEADSSREEQIFNYDYPDKIFHLLMPIFNATDILCVAEYKTIPPPHNPQFSRKYLYITCLTLCITIR
jgi:hypothetical protein